LRELLEEMPTTVSRLRTAETVNLCVADESE
jgi:hypothetical protein